MRVASASRLLLLALLAGFEHRTGDALVMPASRARSLRLLRQGTADNLEKELDALDDMVNDRDPNMGDGPAKKVKMFGVWLDADVAGRKVTKKSSLDNDGEELTPEQKAEVFFQEGLDYFQGGRYPVAAALFQRAVDTVDISSRKGGEFSLWHAQALHAAGDQGEALSILKGLKTHKDRAVSVASQEILYIFKAPKLDLDEDTFVEIPDMSDLDSFEAGRALKFATLKRKVGKVKEEPKRYSQEWLEQQRIYDEPPPGIDPAFAVAVLAACVGSLFFFR